MHISLNKQPKKLNNISTMLKSELKMCHGIQKYLAKIYIS